MVNDFTFTQNEQKIAGRVVDTRGQIIVGARVNVSQSANAEPGLWVRHQQESQSETDALGRFH